MVKKDPKKFEKFLLFYLENEEIHIGKIQNTNKYCLLTLRYIFPLCFMRNFLHCNIMNSKKIFVVLYPIFRHTYAVINHKCTSKLQSEVSSSPWPTTRITRNRGSELKVCTPTERTVVSRPLNHDTWQL